MNNLICKFEDGTMLHLNIEQISNKKIKFVSFFISNLTENEIKDKKIHLIQLQRKLHLIFHNI